MGNLKSIPNYLVILSLVVLNACGQSKNKQLTTQKTNTMENVINKPENPYYSNSDTKKVTLTNAEWKKILPEDLYQVSRHADTERAFTGKMWNSDRKSVV